MRRPAVSGFLLVGGPPVGDPAGLPSAVDVWPSDLPVGEERIYEGADPAAVEQTYFLHVDGQRINPTGYSGAGGIPPGDRGRTCSMGGSTTSPPVAARQPVTTVGLPGFAIGTSCTWPVRGVGAGREAVVGPSFGRLLLTARQFVLLRVGVATPTTSSPPWSTPPQRSRREKSPFPPPDEVPHRRQPLSAHRA